jgi:hypothetical protein
MCTNRDLFRQTGPPKNAGIIHFMFGGRFGVFHIDVVTGCAALWRIFSSDKSAPANIKKGFYTSRLPKNEEIRWIFG